MSVLVACASKHGATQTATRAELTGGIGARWDTVHWILPARAGPHREGTHHAWMLWIRMVALVLLVSEWRPARRKEEPNP
jgi:hypothetical protein